MRRPVQQNADDPAGQICVQRAAVFQEEMSLPSPLGDASFRHSLLRARHAAEWCEGRTKCHCGTELHEIILDFCNWLNEDGGELRRHPLRDHLAVGIVEGFLLAFLFGVVVGNE